MYGSHDSNDIAGPCYLRVFFYTCLACYKIVRMAVNPVKYFSKDLINKPTPLDVWLQGTIDQSVGNDILIISDNFGKVKITKCESAYGVVDKKSICKGTYCCIIGVAIKTKGLPEVQATKFIDLRTQPQMKMAWETEVREAQLLLQGKILPTIK